MIFEKYHALGNDYLVYDPRETKHEFSEEQTIRICHRNFGLGSDGILVGPLPSSGADFGLRILNPDGSEAEKSGNGLRIFARYLRDCNLVEDKSFTVETLGGVVKCQVSFDKSMISVEMGQVSFHSDIIPINVEGVAREVLNEAIVLADQTFNYYGQPLAIPIALFLLIKSVLQSQINMDRHWKPIPIFLIVPMFNFYKSSIETA